MISTGSISTDSIQLGADATSSVRDADTPRPEPTRTRFDPFGQRLAPGDSPTPGTSGLASVHIGFTGHENDDEITVLEGWAGELYGVPVGSTLDAIRLTGRLEGMIIDPVYEGKSMAGLLDLVTSGAIPRDSTVLYAHLGGQPALNAYSALFTT